MPVGSSRLAEGVVVPDEFDITITSNFDDEATIRAAVEGTLPEEAAEEPETPAAEPAAPAVPAAAAPAPPVVDLGYEPKVAGETADQKAERIERNVARIQQLTGVVANKDQHIATLTAEIARLRTPAAAPAAEPVVPAPKFAFPAWEAYSESNPDATHEEYLDARQDARDAFKSHQQAVTDSLARERQAREHSTRAHETIVAESQAHIDAFRQSHADYDAVIKASTAPMTDTMHLTMLRSPAGPALAYHLSQPAHVAEAQRIAQLLPLDQVRALVALELQLTAPASPAPAVPAEPVKPAKRTSQAPAPLAPVAGPAHGTVDVQELSTDEYIAWREQQDVKRGLRR